MTGNNPNGDFTKMLKALEGSDFIIRYVPFGKSKHAEHYKLTDCFCWFWLHFKESKEIKETDYWQHHQKESEINSWRGIAFEEVCLQHVYQIKSVLQIAGVASTESSLLVRGTKETDGMQIDLIIDRADDVVNVCEMKYSKSPFVVSKPYAEKLSKRLSDMESAMPEKTIQMTLVSIKGMERNENSEIFATSIVADDLFR